MEFGIRASTGRPHSYCRPCRGERREEWSEQNPEGQRAIARRKEARRRAYLRDNDWFEYRARFQMPREAGHTAKVLREMWEEQDGRCALTGRALTKQNASIDHIIPIKRGGGHERENLRWVVIEVNRAKRDMLDEEFFAMCRQVAINHGVAYA